MSEFKFQKPYPPVNARKTDVKLSQITSAFITEIHSSTTERPGVQHATKKKWVKQYIITSDTLGRNVREI